MRDGSLAGYLVGVPDDEAIWGPNVWIEFAGHAVEEPELVRDLFAAAAERWVEERRTRHYALVRAGDPALLDAWSRLGFGQQHAYGVRETVAADWDARVRLAQRRDLDTLVDLIPLIARQHARGPVFSDLSAREAARSEETAAAVRDDLEQDFENDEVGMLVAELDGRIVGLFEVVAAQPPTSVVHGHYGFVRPTNTSFLAFAATVPDVRGSGLGVALTDAALSWAHERDRATMITDWRVTNLLASRFWPARGFRTTFLRLYRSIP